MRRVHDRLPPRREEHPQRELPPPRREGGRGRPPDDHGRRPSPRTRRAATPSRPSRPTSAARARPGCCKARRVVLAAGTYGTQTLLHRMKANGQLPHISDRLGELTRTNSEALVGAQTDRPPLPQGPRRARGRLHPGRRDHLLHPPRREHPHRAGPLRQGIQRDGRPVDPPGPVRGRHRVGRLPRVRLAGARRATPLAGGSVPSPTAAGRSGPSSAWSCSPWTTPCRRI